MTRTAWRTLVVALIVDVIVILSILVWPRATGSHRALAAGFAAFPILATMIPACAAASAGVAMALAASVSLIHGLAVFLAAAPASAALASVAESLGFGVGALGLTAFLVDVRASRACAVTLGTIASLALLAAPFLAGPILTHPALSTSHPSLDASIVWINPFAGLASAFRFDWLRADRMYGLSDLGSGPYQYPHALLLAAVLGATGAVLRAAGLTAATIFGRRA